MKPEDETRLMAEVERRNAEMMERVQRALSAELEDMMMNRGQEADECAWINRAFEKINHGDAA